MTIWECRKKESEPKITLPWLLTQWNPSHSLTRPAAALWLSGEVRGIRERLQRADDQVELEKQLTGSTKSDMFFLL